MEEGKAPSCSEKTTGDAVTHGANRQHTAGEDRATLVPKANGTQVQKEAPPHPGQRCHWPDKDGFPSTGPWIHRPLTRGGRRGAGDLSPNLTPDTKLTWLWQPEASLGVGREKIPRTWG